MNCRHKSVELAVLTILVLGVLVACGGGGGGSSSIGFTGGGSGTGSGVTTLVISSTSMPAGIASAPYTFTFTASGGTPPYNWGVTPGYTNITGSSLSADGAFSGTLPQGSWGIAVTVSDSGSPKQTRSTIFSLLIYPQLVITTNSLPASHTNIPYDEIVQANNVKSWTISSGQLPPGVQLMRPISTQVEISGTPTQAGNFSFTIQAESSTGPSQVAAKTLTIAVDDSPAISTSQLLDVILNLSYHDALHAVNGIPPYHWSLQPGSLPSGLTLDSNTGEIGGTVFAPNYQTVYNLTFQVSDSSNPPRSGTRIIPMYLLEALTVFPCNDASVPLGQSYVGSISLYGGRQPYTWTMTSGDLPPGMNFLYQRVIGTPTQMGEYNYVLHVQDSSNPPQFADRACKIIVTPPELTLSNSLPGQMPLGVAFEGFQGAQGGTPPYRYVLAYGNLPVGLDLDSSTGQIKGTPTTLGTSTFTIRVTDSAPTAQVRDINYTIVVVKPLGRNDSIATATPMGNGTVLASISPYSNPLDLVNPDTDYYRIVANAGSTVTIRAVRYYDAIDPVLELVDGNGARLSSCNQPADSNGNFKGTFVDACLNDDIDPGVVQNSALQLKVPGATETQTVFYAHVLDWRGDARPDMVYYFVVDGAVNPLIVTTKPPVNFTNGTAVNLQLQSSGGTGATHWAISSGTLPPGLTLSTSGLLSGTPTANGDFPISMTAMDSGNPAQSVMLQQTFHVADPVQIVSAATFPDACLNKPYSFAVQAASGTPPYVWGFYGLWVAINLNPSTGEFSGTSNVTGTYTGNLSVMDAAGSVARQTVTLTVNPTCP